MEEVILILLKEFRDTIESAQKGDKNALEKILIMFKPIIYKNSFIKGYFDEDCFQELNIELIKCVERFKFDDIKDIHSYFECP